MRRGLGMVVLLCASGILSTAVHAQDSKQQELAAQLAGVMGLDSLLPKVIAASLDQEIAAQPALAAYRVTFDQFVARYLSWDSLRPRIAALYAGTFTVGELRDLIAFYQTATGRKAASTMPALMAQASLLGETLVQEHMADLKTMIEERTIAIQDSVASND